MFEKLFKHIQETYCCNMVLHEKCLKRSDCKLVQFLSYASLVKAFTHQQQKMQTINQEDCRFPF